MASAGILFSVLAVLFIIGAGIFFIFTAGEQYVSTDILVSRYDSGGQSSWKTTIDSGKNDYATAIIETSDGGYAVAGWIAERHGSPTYPRVIRLDQAGNVLWDRTIGDMSIYSADIAEAPDGGFIVAENFNNYDSGAIVRIDSHGSRVWNRTVPSSFREILATGNGLYVLAGSRTLIIDGDGTIVHDFSLPSTSALEARDGSLFLGQSGAPYNLATVYHFDLNRTMTGTWPVGSGESGVIASMQKNAGGDLEVLYTFWNPGRNRDDVLFRESGLVTLGMDGNVSGVRPLVAVEPACRTADGGFVFLAYPFLDSAAYTTYVHSDKGLHMVWLAPDGTVVRDTPLPLPRWVDPKEIIRTRDDGIVTLVMPGH